MVYLSDIESIEELNELSATQLKKLLAMNRVTFKGVVEKEELLKIVTRLWKQEQKAEEGEFSLGIRVIFPDKKLTFKLQFKKE